MMFFLKFKVIKMNKQNRTWRVFNIYIRVDVWNLSKWNLFKRIIEKLSYIYIYKLQK